MSVQTRTIPGVEIARVGTWHTRGKDWTVEEEDLADAVRASQDPDFAPAVVHAGHSDPRFDGEPALGTLANYRVSEDGQALLADLVKVPVVVADIMESAWPRRSIEAALDVVSNSGKSYRMVTTGLALLGVQLPAIETLADLPALYGTSEQIAASSRQIGRQVAASMEAGMPEVPEQRLRPHTVRPGAVSYDDQDRPVAINGHPVRRPRLVEASAPLDGLWDAFREWARAQSLDVYIEELGTDYVLACGWASEGAVWRVPWSEADGVFTFGAPVKGAMIWQAGEPKAGATVDAAAADSGSALPSSRGRGSVDDSRKDLPVDLTPRMRELLGLAEDATPEQAEAALTALQAKATAGSAGPEDEDKGEDSGETETAPAPTSIAPAALDKLITERVAAAMRPMTDTIADLSGQLAERRAAEAADTRTRVITAALDDGKITPADQGSWEQRYDAAPEVITEVLASMRPGTAMPVRHVAASLGHSGHSQSGASAEDQLYAQVFGQSTGGGE